MRGLTASTNQAEPKITRAVILATARTWIGTPYHHQACALGVGADCVGFIRGIWRALYDHDAEIPPGYSRDWAEATGMETLIESARRHLTEIAPANAKPGDVLVFRFRPHLVAKHAALLASDTTLIHALEGAAVAEVPYGPWWRRRVAATFSFPGIID
ncbi:MAG: NlpC/P60 family protein [Hyphomicrobiaceae bacterium]